MNCLESMTVRSEVPGLLSFFLIQIIVFLSPFLLFNLMLIFRSIVMVLLSLYFGTRIV
jgi:hypothetical protein